MTTLKKAIELIAPLAKQYKPKQDANWICFFASDSPYEETYEPSNCKIYCEDCIEKAIEKLNNDPLTVLPKNFKSFTYDTEAPKEGEDFCCCSDCSEIIHQSIIFTRQEMAHWAKVTDAQFKKGLKDSRFCYELKKVLSDAEYPKEVEKLAKKTINLSK